MGKWKEKAKQLEAQVAELESLLTTARHEKDLRGRAVFQREDEIKKLTSEAQRLANEALRLKEARQQLEADIEELQEGAEEMANGFDALKPFKAMVEWLQEHGADLYAPGKGAMHWSTITGYGSNRVITKGATAEEALRNSMERSEG
jgi:chromosome segregation ATPase